MMEPTYHTLTAEELRRMEKLGWGEALMLHANQTARNQIEVNDVTVPILEKLAK